MRRGDEEALVGQAADTAGQLDVSVLVPVYNVERYLRQCLDSLAAQTIGSAEFICLNDGSTDSSPAILRD